MTYITQNGITVPDWSTATDEEIDEGYRAMVADKEREAEAFEWIESHVGDGLVQR